MVSNKEIQEYQQLHKVSYKTAKSILEDSKSSKENDLATKENNIAAIAFEHLSKRLGSDLEVGRFFDSGMDIISYEKSLNAVEALKYQARFKDLDQPEKNHALRLGCVDTTNKLFAIQHGGYHYKMIAIQPIIMYDHLNLGFKESCVIKYVLRYADKNGVEDLKKAIHYLQFIAVSGRFIGDKINQNYIRLFAELNDLKTFEIKILDGLQMLSVDFSESLIESMIFTIENRIESVNKSKKV